MRRVLDRIEARRGETPSPRPPAEHREEDLSELVSMEVMSGLEASNLIKNASSFSTSRAKN